MSEAVVLQAVHAFMAKDVDGILAVADGGWLGARVRAGKITFFGFFRTEEDATEAVSSRST